MAEIHAICGIYRADRHANRSQRGAPRARVALAAKGGRDMVRGKRPRTRADPGRGSHDKGAEMRMQAAWPTARAAYVALALALVLVAMPAAARAESPPHWYSNGTLLKEGVKETAATSGTLTFRYVVAQESEVTCTITDKDTVENPAGGGPGIDELTQVTFSGCFIPTGGHNNAPVCGSGTPEAIPHALPWHTLLLPGSRDEISGVDIELKCSGGSVLETLTGTLAPTLSASVLTFTSATGALVQSGFGGDTTNVLGNDTLTGPPGDETLTSGSGQPQLFPHWYSNGQLLGEEPKAQTVSWGRLTFHTPLGDVSCKKSDAGNIWNPLGGGAGLDETVLFDLYECSSEACPGAQVTASGLPWPSELQEAIAGTGVILDATTGIQLTVRCGELQRTFEGTLTPRVVNRPGTAEPTFEEFGEGSGELASKEGGTLSVSGNDYVRGFDEGDEVVTAGSEREFPGIGRCLKVARGTGKYKTAACDTAEVPNGNYEWFGGAVKNHFTSSEGASVYETTGGAIMMRCTSDTDSGIYNGESEDRETITFVGCESNGQKCTTGSLAPGTVQTSELRSLYGFIKNPGKVGTSLEAVSGPFMEFKCGSTNVVVRGSVIGTTTPINKMSPTFVEKFVGAKDRQNVQKFEGEPLDVLESSVGGGPYGPSQFTSTDTITNEEPLEIRTKP